MASRIPKGWAGWREHLRRLLPRAAMFGALAAGQITHAVVSRYNMDRPYGEPQHDMPLLEIVQAFAQAWAFAFAGVMALGLASPFVLQVILGKPMAKT